MDRDVLSHILIQTFQYETYHGTSSLQQLGQLSGLEPNIIMISLYAFWIETIFTETVKKQNYYRKFPKCSDTQTICCNHSKIWTMWLYHRVISPNDTDGITNSVDPDQTAPLGAVWSGSALFAQEYLSENLGTLR